MFTMFFYFFINRCRHERPKERGHLNLYTASIESRIIYGPALFNDERGRRDGLLHLRARALRAIADAAAFRWHSWGTQAQRGP